MKFAASILAAFLLLCSVSLADERSGPGRRTVLREGWGTVFIEPAEIRGDYELSMNEDGNLYTLSTAEGKVEIHESQEDVKLVFPDFEAQVHFEPESLVVEWGNDKHTFFRQGNKMTYSGPKGQVTFLRGERQLEITGPRGTVTIKDGDGEYTVESTLGKTTYTTMPSGFKVTGPRLTQHPYLKRGAVFSHNGVGMYVELALLDPKNPLFRLLEWNTIIELESTGP